MSFWTKFWRTFSRKKKVDVESSPDTPIIKTNSNGVSFEVPASSLSRSVTPTKVTPKLSFWTPPEHNKHFTFIPKNYFEINRPFTIQTQRCPGANSYFEVQILDSLPAASIFIGLAPLKMDTHLIPGLFEKSIALEVKTRKFYRGGNLIDVSPFKRFQPNDIISVHMKYILSDDLYYEIQYKNQYNETIPLQIISKCFLAPTIHATAACRIQVNFGETPFKNIRDKSRSPINLTKSNSASSATCRQSTSHPHRQNAFNSHRQIIFDSNRQTTFDLHRQSTLDPYRQTTFDYHRQATFEPYQPNTFDSHQISFHPHRHNTFNSHRQSNYHSYRQSVDLSRKRTT